MGQNTQPPTLSTSNPQPHDPTAFFEQQVQFYRWRANPAYNRNIARVHVSSSASLRDQQQLASLVQQRVKQQQHVSINQILRLAQAHSPRPSDQIMTFEKYLCTLTQLQNELSLPQALYCVQTLLQGHETLFQKLGYSCVSLENCLVTAEGEVRAWISPNPQVNHPLPNASILESQVAIIKKILEVCEIVALNHTEFLHFSRQCKSFMDRNILEHCNFATFSRLTRKYIQNYQIIIPVNLASALNRVKEPQLTTPSYTCTPKSSTTSNPTNSLQQLQLRQACQSLAQKYDMESTGQTFKTPTINKPPNRPNTHSQHFSSTQGDLSRKRSLRGNHKKHSSTHNLRQFLNGSEGTDTPQMGRSQFATLTSKANPFQVKDLNQSFTHPTKNTGNIDMTPKCFTEYVKQEVNKKEESEQHSKIETKEVKQGGGILKRTSQKQKKKLEKKPIKKTSIQQTVQQMRKTTFVQPSIACFEYSSPSNSNFVGNTPISTPANKVELTKKAQSTPFEKKFNDSSYKGTNPRSRPGQYSVQVSASELSAPVLPRQCITMTMNKLLDNSDVIIQQSVGTLMSVPQNDSGQGSYHGVLSTMGRSVDVRNIPSNKLINCKRGSHSHTASINWD